MKKLIKNTITVFYAVMVITMHTKAAAPGWTVNPAGFQYNMTLMSVASINCTELDKPGNAIAVFSGNECRGVAQTSQVINGRYIASLFIYSNMVAGEMLTFKIYDTTKDSVYAAHQSIQFQQNAAYGTASSPFVVLTNNAPTAISLSSYKFLENLPLRTPVATLTSTDADSGDTFTYALVAGDGDKDNSNFRIVNDQLTVNAKMDYETQAAFSIRLRSTDQNGCAAEKAITLSLINEVEAKDPLPARNFISPNGDGVNDFFVIANIDSYVDYSLSVYNESGMEVFSADRGYSNNWDGTYNGKPLPDGAYMYILKNDAKGISFKGILNIVTSN
jgi:gliding motility-associated-like protein